jgi:hypothetical protein
VHVTAGVLFLLYREVRPTLLRLEMPEDFLRGRFLLQVVPLGLLAGALLLFRSRPGPVLAFALLLLLVERRLESGRLYPTFPNRAFYPPLAVLDPIPRAAPYRFTAVGFNFVPNVSALYELEDVRGYEAMTFQPLVDTFPLWCVPQPVWFNRVDDPTTPFLAFLNVRWVLAPDGWNPPRGWKHLSAGDGMRLFQNPDALARVFAPRKVREIAGEAGQRDALGSISDFADQGIVGKETSGPDAGWRENGAADVRIDSYQPQRLDVSVDARSAAIVGTSIPRWPGWKLEIDGRRAPTVPYNRAFLGFAVEPGRHRAVLRYRPDGFVAGSAISGATAAACLAAMLATRRRREPAAP